jgi:ParB-like chromosome segregation protein Spo0J
VPPKVSLARFYLSKRLGRPGGLVRRAMTLHINHFTATSSYPRLTSSLMITSAGVRVAEKVSESQTYWLPVASLLSADSPRLLGEVSEHTRLLAESGQPFPPILVHKRRMQVIDGMHRLRATILRGEESIEAVLFDGDEAEVFLIAVRSNIEHGLPLTRADREAAAIRIIKSHPEHSDRMIGSIVGLAPVTVAAIRQRSCQGDVDLDSRLGRDGRVRPLSSAAARLAASRMLAENPGASLRQVAESAGLSPATVRDVRERMSRGDDPVPDRERRHRGARHSRSALERGKGDRSGPTRSLKMLLQNLKRDPSLHYSESGRALLHWLFSHAKGPDGGEELAATVPDHAVYVIAELARACAGEWLSFADRLEGQVRGSDSA